MMCMKSSVVIFSEDFRVSARDSRILLMMMEKFDLMTLFLLTTAQVGFGNT